MPLSSMSSRSAPRRASRAVALRSGDPTYVSHKQDNRCWAARPGSFPGAVQPDPRSLVRWLLAWPVRFRVQQMSDQLAVGEQHDPGEQRQHIGQSVGVLLVVDKNTRHSKLGRSFAGMIPQATTKNKQQSVLKYKHEVPLAIKRGW